MNYKQANRRAWSYLARNGCDSSQPYGPREFANAFHWLDDKSWINWARVKSVLCLACGGGQQAPLFASLGCQVTVADMSPEQLRIDREVAEKYGLSIECVEADMLDLSRLRGRNFDLVYQAVSTCYVPDVRRLYREVFSVLCAWGQYRVEHWNPTHLQLSDSFAWDGEAYRVVQPQTTSGPLPWVVQSGENGNAKVSCLHYLHPLHDLIGGLCDSGFAILRFAESGESDLSAEPGSYRHLAAYLPSFYSILARRRN
jgi:ubiquinone/menaquinone biosynthesis C-methylase UbiE